MENLLKCPACGKTIIAEEEFTHKCIFEAIEIPVSYYYEVIGNGEKVIVAKGTGGKFYRLVAESPDAGQPKKTTEVGTICQNRKILSAK